MNKSKRNQILSAIGLLDKAHDALKRAMETGNADIALTLLEQCQDSAIRIGGMIEEAEGEGFVTIGLLENYCETIYQSYEQIRQQQSVNAGKVFKNLRREMIQIENSVKNDISVRTSAVFLPYKASMWDSLESVWKAADADPDCDAYVIPIPYFDKNPDGTFGEAHYEGNKFPADVPVTGYEDYDFEENRPDIIFIHNPYDECNHVTSVHPFFYIKNLKNFTDKIVYIPYFILGEDMYESMCVTPGTVFTDGVIVHSVPAKEDYIRYLKKFYLENGEVRGKAAEKEVEKMLREKILPLGSPKIDKVVNGRREDYALPEAWEKKLDGRKAVLYNTGVSGILHGNEQELTKIQDTINYFAGRDDVVLWWRPHPLSGSTMQSMRPQIFDAYQALVEEYKRSGIGIYDDTADLHRALLWTDMYYGDDSSLIYLYGVQGKPIVRQSVGVLTEKIANEPNPGICYKAVCHVKDSIFFTDLDYNRLYRLYLEKKEVVDLGEIPQEWQMERSLYSNIIYNDGVLWLVPSRAHAVAAYHLDTGSWERWELPERIKSSSIADGTLYMLSSDYRHLWMMDLQEKKLVKKEITYRQEEKLALSDEYYNDDLYMVNGKLYYLITHSDLLAVYDLASGQAELQHIGAERKRYQRLLRGNGGFWCLPRDEKDGIVYWDGTDFKESDSDGYPEDFSFQWGFSHAVFQNGDILLFPIRGNMILRLDPETMRTVCVLKMDENIDIHSVCPLQDGKIAFSYLDTLTQRDGRVAILDTDGKVLVDYSVMRPDGFVVDAASMFERVGVENYHSAAAYQIGETGVCTLFQVCDALVNGKSVYRAEQEYFRSLYANSDGTAGFRIWEALKVW